MDGIAKCFSSLHGEKRLGPAPREVRGSSASEALGFQTLPATLTLLEILGASVSMALAESFSDPDTTGATRRVGARQVPAGASLDAFEYGRFPPEWQDAELQL